MPATSQDARLRALLDDVVTDLAGKIRQMVLEDLILSLNGRPALGPNLTTTTRLSKRRAPKTAEKAKTRKARVPRDPAAAAERRKKILAAVATGKGMSAGEVAKAAGLPRETVDYSLKVLRKEKKVFMAGERAAARWATSPEVAKRAVAGS